MDSSTHLDYAVFQLTPTRTRCDLVICCNGKTEKLASGLFQPFVSHLKFAKDEISKGGYSITLRPPVHDVSWFTKATFERFVRFVSTPEILERFISLEKEISHIESSLQANELENAQADKQEVNHSSGNIDQSNSPEPKAQGETAENSDVAQEENSRTRLQRLLETRKTLLLKSQAMAYARGRAAGFDMDDMEDLISFADAFGASRLRQACNEFKEICGKKQADVPWMEQLNAMEAYSPAELLYPGNSGIMLANEMLAPSQDITLHSATSSDTLVSNGSTGASTNDTTMTDTSSDGKKDQMPQAKMQMQIPWPNQLLPYGYPVQQMPPYQGYPFPMMQPSYQWPFGVEPPNKDPRKEGNRNGKKKERKSRKEEDAECSSEEIQDDSIESDSESDQDLSSSQENKDSSTDHVQKKKHRKKHSRTVVIRNINYITSKSKDGEEDEDSDGSSAGDELFNGDILKKQVEDAVGSLKKNHKSKKHTRKAKSSNADEISENDSHDSNGRNIDDTNASQEKKTNENWDAFQSLLMRNDESDSETKGQHQTDERSFEGDAPVTVDRTVNLEAECVRMPRRVEDDSLLVTARNGRCIYEANSVDFAAGENPRPGLRTRESSDETLLFSKRFDGSDSGHDGLPDFAGDASLSKSRKHEDWSLVHRMGKSEVEDAAVIKHAMYDGDYILPSNAKNENSRRDMSVDDSIMIQSRSSMDDSYDFQSGRDISLVAEIALASEQGTGTLDASADKNDVSKTYKADDLCMLLERDAEPDSTRLSWSVDSAIDISLVEAARPSVVETKDDAKPESEVSANQKKQSPAKKTPTKDAKSKTLNRTPGRSSPSPMSRTPRPAPVRKPVVPKSKLEQEEEMRKRMEEMLIQRQKRIAERTAASGLSPASTKKSPGESKTIRAPVKGNSKSPSSVKAVNRTNSQGQAVRV